MSGEWAAESESDEEDISSTLEKPPATTPDALEGVDILRQFLQSQQDANEHFQALNAVQSLISKSAAKRVETALDKYLQAPSPL